MTGELWKPDGSMTEEYRDTVVAQINLWIRGISKHNTFSDECTPDFSCCVPSMLMPEEKRIEYGKRILLEFVRGVI